MMTGRSIVLPWEACRDPAYLRGREWLVTNVLGGYASGTLAGIPSRRYHGLLVPNHAAPKGRHIVISHCDETVIDGTRRARLGGAEYADGSFIGETHLYLREFRLDRRIACWLFDVDGVQLEKSILMPHGQNTVCVYYRVLNEGALDLQIRPFVLFRRHDSPPQPRLDTTFTLTVTDGRHEVRHQGDEQLVLRMGLHPQPAAFTTDSHEHEFFYRVDHDRGDPFLECAFSPGYFTAHVDASRPVAFFASTQTWEKLQFAPAELLEAERRRMDSLLAAAPALEGDDFAQQLAMAADQFVVLPGSRLDERVMAQAEGSDLRTIYAGYHWFGDWGRDTMISLEGLTLCTGRHLEAAAILRTFSHYVKDGLLPNLFPEGARQALYHTVDATLWYFHAIDRYLRIVDDRHLLADLFPVLQSIVEHYVAGTHFGIRADTDGLITAGADGYQLTWMDAKVGDWVVTPRRGKPVEIQALWYNALCLMAQWSVRLQQSPEPFERRSHQVRQVFNERYWNSKRGCLFDVLDGPHGADASIRPNQVFSISLAHPVLDQARWLPVLQVIQARLLTPYGLRTLSPEDSDYKPHYRGDLRARDAAYHQGTVWPWLIGHFIDAWLHATGDAAHAHTLLSAFRGHLCDAGIGSISEIFDAEEPNAPGGCIAQAWSVAEVLRSRLNTRSAAQAASTRANE